MNLKQTTLIYALFLASVFTTQVIAAEQTITPSKLSFGSVKANQEIEVTLKYTGDINTSGVSVKMYFDSSQLSFLGTSAVFEQDLNAIDDSAKADKGNGDNNAKTDATLNAAWVSLKNPPTWPGKTPVDLYTVKFKTTANFSGSTSIKLIGKPKSVSTKDITISSDAVAGTEGADNTEPPPPKKKKKSGSLSLLFLFPLAMLGLFRRRFTSKQTV